jgi:hypothetical protein
VVSWWRMKRKRKKGGVGGAKRKNGESGRADVGVEEEAERGEKEGTYKCVCVRAFWEGVIGFAAVR